MALIDFYNESEHSLGFKDCKYHKKFSLQTQLFLN